MRPLLAFLLASLAVAPAAPGLAAETAMLSQSAVLHDGPGARFARLGVVERNQQATVKSCNKSGRWCEIEAGDKQGWVMAQYLSKVEPASAAAKPPSIPQAAAKTPPPPAVIVETEKATKGDRGPIPGKPVTITFKSADGKVSSTMTVAAGTNVVVTASGRSRCELKTAVNP
jgi:hypothetical protein